MSTSLRRCQDQQLSPCDGLCHVTALVSRHLDDLRGLEHDAEIGQVLEELDGAVALQVVHQVLVALPDAGEKEGHVVILHSKDSREELARRV
jgi:hypothetical protein